MLIFEGCKLNEFILLSLASIIPHERLVLLFINSLLPRLIIIIIIIIISSQ